jgi:hypothetical protein
MITKKLHQGWVVMHENLLITANPNKKNGREVQLERWGNIDHEEIRVGILDKIIWMTDSKENSPPAAKAA